MNDEYRLTEKGRDAVQTVCEAVAAVVATRPAGYPAGELWAALMSFVPELSQFEMLMRVAVRGGHVERRGQLYFRREK